MFKNLKSMPQQFFFTIFLLVSCFCVMPVFPGDGAVETQSLKVHKVFFHNLVATVDAGNVVRVWDLGTQKILQTIEVNRQVTALSWSSDKRRLMIQSITLGGEFRIDIFCMQKGRLKFPEYQSVLNGSVFLPGGNSVATILWEDRPEFREPGRHYSILFRRVDDGKVWHQKFLDGELKNIFCFPNHNSSDYCLIVSRILDSTKPLEHSLVLLENNLLRVTQYSLPRGLALTGCYSLNKNQWLGVAWKDCRQSFFTKTPKDGLFNVNVFNGGKLFDINSRQALADFVVSDSKTEAIQTLFINAMFELMIGDRSVTIFFGLKSPRGDLSKETSFLACYLTTSYGFEEAFLWDFGLQVLQAFPLKQCPGEFLALFEGNPGLTRIKVELGGVGFGPGKLNLSSMSASLVCSSSTPLTMFTC